jgi:hypothetical protein
MLPPMLELLPPPEEREWIIDGLGQLARLTGWEPLVCAPLLLPESRFFPDRWSPDADGARRLARRLQSYAGLDDLGVTIELFARQRESPARGVIPHSVQHEGAAAYFAGIVEDVSVFGIDVEQLHDGLGVTAALAHEVAHAFRARFELAIADAARIDEEERLTDLTTIYLGAGVLTTNAAARHRSAGHDAGLLHGHQWSFRTLGYLSPSSMAYALAVVAVVRGLGRAARRELVATLELNQAASFKRAVSELDPQCSDLRTRLGVPLNPADWPRAWSLDELTAPIADPLPSPADDDQDDEDDDEPPWNLGRPVFRVLPGYQTGDTLLVSVMVSIFGALVGGDMVLGAIIGAVGFFATPVLIRKLGAQRCSDPDCMTRLHRAATSCPNCGGTIMGTIRGRQHRLAAEERLALEREHDESSR